MIDGISITAIAPVMSQYYTPPPPLAPLPLLDHDSFFSVAAMTTGEEGTAVDSGSAVGLTTVTAGARTSDLTWRCLRWPVKERNICQKALKEEAHSGRYKSGMKMKFYEMR